MIRGIVILILGIAVIVLRFLLDSRQRMKNAKKTKGKVASSETTENTIKYYVQFKNADGEVMHSYTAPYKKTQISENAIKDGSIVRIKYNVKKYFGGKMNVAEVEIIDKRLEKYSGYGAIMIAGVAIIAFGIFNITYALIA